MGTAAANLNAAKSLLAENIFCGQTFGLKKRALNTVTAQLEGGGAKCRSALCFLVGTLLHADSLVNGDADTGTAKQYKMFQCCQMLPLPQITAMARSIMLLI